MEIILLLLVIAIQLGHIWFTRPVAAVEPDPVTDHDVQVAIAAGMADAGLNVEDYSMSFNLKTTGKLGEVLYHAAGYLNKKADTVQDLHDLLSK